MPHRHKFLAEPGSKIGMRDRNERLSAPAQREAMKVDGPILRHHPVNVAPGRDDAGTWRELADDARDGPIFGRGGEREDGFSAARQGGTANKVHLSADT